jgi:cytochrome c-type biogenesis protein CcmH
MLESIPPTLRALALSLTLIAGLVSSPLQAKEAAPVAANEQVEARMMALANELRCLVCQNQTIADSHADLALDLRQQIREMIAKGDSDRQILDYMTARYGDFVLYRPPFKATTALLWAGPAVLLLMAMGMLFIVLRRRSRLGADAYDPDTSEVNR